MTSVKPIIPKFSNPSHSPTSLFPYPYSYTLTSERSFTQGNKSLSKLLPDDIHIFPKKNQTTPTCVPAGDQAMEQMKGLGSVPPWAEFPSWCVPWQLSSAHQLAGIVVFDARCFKDRHHKTTM